MLKVGELEKGEVMKKASVVKELWGDEGPYSQAQLITEVRILNDSISRTFVIVSVNINPYTMKYVRKHIDLFKEDQLVVGIATNAVYEGPRDGYAIYVFQHEYINEDVIKEAKEILNDVNEAIIRMHKFVMDNIISGRRSKSKRKKSAKDDRGKMLATQRLMTATFIERYLKETGKEVLSGIDEANMVMKQMMSWWNAKLTREERLRIETLTKKEQVKIFMNAEINFTDAYGKISNLH